MKLARNIIESSTGAICYLKRNRRFPVKPGQIVKLNLGAGLAVCKGWINIDGSLNALIASWPLSIHRFLYRFTGANRYYSLQEYCRILAENEFLHHDLSYGIPFEDGSVDYVYSSHFLEHLFRQDAARLLKESFRVLRYGGAIRICVPDLAHAVSMYNSGQKEKMLENYFFVNDLDSYMARHKYMYDFEIISGLLREAGFSNIAKRAFQSGEVPDLNILDNRSEETLFVEALK